MSCPGRASRPQVIESDTLDVLTLNVAHGRGRALSQLLVSADRHRRNLADIAAQLRRSGAHVVALQEADAPSLWSGRFDHVQALADATGCTCFVHGRHARGWMYSYGTALMSSYQLSDLASHGFEPSIPTTTKGFVRAAVTWKAPGDDAKSRRVTLVSVHLDFSRPAVREAQVAELVGDLTGLNAPLVIMGDFNADWSREDSPVREVARQFDLRAFRPMASGLETYKGRRRLDWILISRDLVFVESSVIPTASDHLAVSARIGLASSE